MTRRSGSPGRRAESASPTRRSGRSKSPAADLRKRRTNAGTVETARDTDFVSETGGISAKYYRKGLLFEVWDFVLDYLATCIIVLILLVLYRFGSVQREVIDLIQTHSSDFYKTVFGTILTVVLAIIYLVAKKRSIYCIDYAVFKATEEDKKKHFYNVGEDNFNKMIEGVENFSEESLEFQRKIWQRSCIGDQTILPKALLPPKGDISIDGGRAEAELILFRCMDDLLAKTGISPKQVDILVVNCSLFNPTPSITSMIVNRYKMRSNIRTYNLSGMGCSAGVISIDLAKDLLQVHRNKYAVVISTENMNQNFYQGNDKGMLLQNTLFRCGGAAILLTNKTSERSRSKFELLHTVRTHKGSNDESYRAVFQECDGEGKMGVRLSKSLMDIAGDALKTNITTLGPLILPWTEQAKFFFSMFQKRVLGKKGRAYVPDFKKAVEHFCIHAGGRAVIDALEKNLDLTPHHVEPSRYSLKRWGNTSSASIWYEMLFCEERGRIQKGDRVWQIAFGSGFKCNSAVWRSLRTMEAVPDPS